MPDYMFLGYRSEEEFLEDIVGCDENYTLEDFLVHMTLNKTRWWARGKLSLTGWRLSILKNKRMEHMALRIWVVVQKGAEN